MILQLQEQIQSAPGHPSMLPALVLIAIAVISGVTMGVMRVRGTLVLPIPVFWIHASMVLGALVILILKAH